MKLIFRIITLPEGTYSIRNVGCQYNVPALRFLQPDTPELWFAWFNDINYMKSFYNKVGRMIYNPKRL